MCTHILIYFLPIYAHICIYYIRVFKRMYERVERFIILMI